MKFSIICPVKNEVKIISRMINSIINQDEDFEILFVGISEDGTKEKIESYQDNRIKFIESNLPIHGAVELGRTMLSGDIMVNMGADDYFFKDCFKQVKQALEISKKNVIAGLAMKSDGTVSENYNHKVVATPACFFKTDFIKKHNLKYEWQKYPELADYVIRAKSWFIEEPYLLDKFLVCLEVSNESPIHTNKARRYFEYREFLKEVLHNG